nr:MAG TPA: hypothetical protein [Caudoviricetes sp.]
MIDVWKPRIRILGKNEHIEVRSLVFSEVVERRAVHVDEAFRNFLNFYRDIHIRKNNSFPTQKQKNA